MRVLLVRPRRLNAMTLFGGIACEPLELETLLPACRAAGAETAIYDGITESRPFSKVVRGFAPDVVAVTGYLTQEREMRAYARLAKSAAPGCAVVLGGVHAQLCHRRLHWPEADYVFRSESAAEFRRLLEGLAAGAVPGDIPGLCRRTGEGWAENPYAPGDMDGLPLPDRSGWAARADWFRYLDWPRISTLKTAASCPFSCRFCYGRNLHGGQYQARRLDLVLDELEQVPGETVFIVDSDFLLDEGRVRAFLAGVRDRGIRKRYLCYARADFIAAHPALVGELCQTGFAAFLVGLEGIADQRLAAWDKGTTSRVNETCLAVLAEYGADCVALLLADPEFRKEDFRALYRWVKGTTLRYVSVQILTPLPETPLFEEKMAGLDGAERPDLRSFDLTHLVLPPKYMTRRAYRLRYWLLLLRLALLGFRRGAYRFVTPAYLAKTAARALRRAAALR